MGKKFKPVFLTPGEMSQWLAGWCSQHKLCTGILSRDGSLTTREGWVHSEGAVVTIQSAWEIWLEVLPLRSIGETTLGLMKANYDRFTIHPPKWLDSSTLRESLFGWSTTDPARVVIWKTIAADLRSKTKAGLWIVNPHDHAHDFYKEHRYSEEAAALYNRGISLQVFVGINIARLDAP
jgi:hypothetical protein